MRACTGLLVLLICVMSGGENFVLAGAATAQKSKRPARSAAKCPDYSDCQVTKVHVHYVPTHPKKLHCLIGPPPPDLPVLQAVAIRRVPLPDQRTNFRFRQEAGRLEDQPEGGAAPEGGAPPEEDECDDLRKRMEDLESSMLRLVEVASKHEAILEKLHEKLTDPSGAAQK